MARMIAELERAIVDGDRTDPEAHGCAELAGALAQALGEAAPATLVAHERLKPRVFRLRLASGTAVHSFVAKRMSPEHARRNERVIRCWLPELGLGDLAPSLLGVAAGPDGRWVWHVYEDLGSSTLAGADADPERVAAAVRRIAKLHSAFAAHPLLAECRLVGADFGRSFLASNVRDAIHALDRLRPPRLEPTTAQAALRDRLLGRLRAILEREPLHARALAAWSGPETLLHGDLWTTNAFVEPSPSGLRVRLIDWDRAGVGPASYDLSTLLMRFAPERRPGIVTLYREAVREGDWRMPGTRELNLLFEIAEWSRYANRVIWPAIAVLRERASWGFDELAAVEGWFEALGPVIPEDVT